MEDNKIAATGSQPCNGPQGNNIMILGTSIGIVLIALGMLWAITYSAAHLTENSHPFELKLFFAIGILTGLALLFAFAIAVYVWGPQAANSTESPGKAVFDACVKVIPPIITLILGAYFGISSSAKDETKPASSPDSKIEQAHPASEAAAAPTMDKIAQKNKPQHQPSK